MSVLGTLAAALGRARRVPRVGFTRLTTKQGPRGYYKGKGAAPTGHHTNKGEQGARPVWRARCRAQAAILHVGACRTCAAGCPAATRQSVLSFTDCQRL